MGLSRAETGFGVLSAIFFSASAYAQANDPDPAFWVALYLGGGWGLNGLAWISSTEVGEKHSEEGWTTAARDCAIFFGTLITVYVWNTSMALSEYLAVDINFQLQPLGIIFWKVLEREEGRELAGLILLLAHTVTILCYLHNKLHPGSRITAVAAQVLVFGVAVLIVAGIYMWVRYQPALNAAYKQPHCDGMMPLKPQGI
mmetsp:Transcript_146546/g.207828  ORF Transcript_146546/g.207828 Transcript_146546/m.207828 type:complete len:200 (-) Transcript_146546:32-631(-)